MNTLEKILEEIEEEIKSFCNRAEELKCGRSYIDGANDVVRNIKDIIRSLILNGEDATITKNDGWIPVNEEMPPFMERLQATIKHHEWIEDYNSSWVSEEDKDYHKEYTEVCEIFQIDGKWFFADKEDDYEVSAAYIEPKKDLGNPICEIIAWKPHPEPYRPEEG